jgi:hypothetical protein
MEGVTVGLEDIVPTEDFTEGIVVDFLDGIADGFAEVGDLDGLVVGNLDGFVVAAQCISKLINNFLLLYKQYSFK